MSKKAVHFGAGNIGRGFIGPLLVQSGHHVVFADIDANIIDKINEQGEYKVHFLESSNKRQRPLVVSDISGVISTSEGLVETIAAEDTDIITTSVGINILPRLAPSIAKGIAQRRKKGCGPLNVIACENGVGATAKLAKAVDSHLNDDDRAYVKTHVGFANCSVDRIVPPFKADSPLDVGVESFYEWIVESPPLKSLSPITGLTLTPTLTPYVHRKLFTLNAGHAITAYLGLLEGHSTIHDAIASPHILNTVHGAMREAGAVLLKDHSEFNKEDHEKYIEKILDRFRNPHVDDSLVRVGREPLRKLSKNDRLVGPLLAARNYGFEVKCLSKGVAAALWYGREGCQGADDEQARELRAWIRRDSVRSVVEELLSPDGKTDEGLANMVVGAYWDLGREYDVVELEQMETESGQVEGGEVFEMKASL